MSEHTNDLENLLSNPRKAIFSMAVPLFFSMLVGQLQNFIDGIWCSGLGSDELSAISISSPIYQLIIAFGSGIGVGASAAVAKFLGSGDKHSAEKTATATIVLILLISIASSLIMWPLAEPLITFCGGGNNVSLSMSYTMPFFYASFFLMMNGIWAGLMRAEGASKKSMILSITASVINMVLDPIMIYWMGMGVVGASIATCLSFVVTTAIGFWWYLSGRNYIHLHFRKFRFDRITLMEIFVVGIPCAIEMILSPLIVIPEQAIVVSCGGSDGLVVYINAFRFISLALLPASAISKSLIPILSAAMGQRDMPKIRECIRMTYKIVVSMELVLSLFIFISAGLLVQLFMNSDSMRALEGELVLATRIYCITCLFNSVQGVGMSILQASRHATLATLMTFIREFIFLGTYFVAAHISMTAIYWSLDLTNLFAMLIISMLVMYAIKLISHDIKLQSKNEHSIHE